MSLKYTSYNKNVISVLAWFLGIYLLCLFLCFGVQAQTIEIKPEDIETAQIKTEEIKTTQDKYIKETELLISNLDSDAETTAIYLEELQWSKNIYQTKETSPEFLELLYNEHGIVKQKIDADTEQIQAYKDQITAFQNRSKVYADWVMLLSSAVKLAETIAVTPSDH